MILVSLCTKIFGCVGLQMHLNLTDSRNRPVQNAMPILYHKDLSPHLSMNSNVRAVLKEKHNEIEK